MTTVAPATGAPAPAPTTIDQLRAVRQVQAECVDRVAALCLARIAAPGRALPLADLAAGTAILGGLALAAEALEGRLLRAAAA